MELPPEEVGVSILDVQRGTPTIKNHQEIIKKHSAGVPAVAQWGKDLALSLQQFRWLLRCRYDFQPSAVGLGSGITTAAAQIQSCCRCKKKKKGVEIASGKPSSFLL